jgi:hypothetical protein
MHLKKDIYSTAKELKTKEWEATELEANELEANELEAKEDLLSLSKDSFKGSGLQMD